VNKDNKDPEELLVKEDFLDLQAHKGSGVNLDHQVLMVLW
jgi:hypothetical protein